MTAVLETADARRAVPARLLYSLRRWDEVIYRDALPRLADGDATLEVALTFTVLRLPAGDGPPPSDPRVQFILEPVGRIVASLRHGNWDDDEARVEEFALDRLETVVAGFEHPHRHATLVVASAHSRCEKRLGKFAQQVAPPALGHLLARDVAVQRLGQTNAPPALAAFGDHEAFAFEGLLNVAVAFALDIREGEWFA